MVSASAEVPPCSDASTFWIEYAAMRVTAPDADGVGHLRIVDGFDGEVFADVPASSLHDAAPLYDRPMAEPADLAARRADEPVVPADADETSWL